MRNIYSQQRRNFYAAIWPLALNTKYKRRRFEVKHHTGMFWKHPCSQVEREEVGATVYFSLKRKAEGTKNNFFACSLGRQDTSFHRITESQNSRGWKGPLWVI